MCLRCTTSRVPAAYPASAGIAVDAELILTVVMFTNSRSCTRWTPTARSNAATVQHTYVRTLCVAAFDGSAPAERLDGSHGWCESALRRCPPPRACLRPASARCVHAPRCHPAPRPARLLLTRAVPGARCWLRARSLTRRLASCHRPPPTTARAPPSLSAAGTHATVVLGTRWRLERAVDTQPRNQHCAVANFARGASRLTRARNFCSASSPHGAPTHTDAP